MNTKDGTLRIIDKNKDYYDYLAHQVDSDDGVTFDRRGSIPLQHEDFFNIGIVNSSAVPKHPKCI